MWEAVKRWLEQKPAVVPVKAPDAWKIREQEERERLTQGHRWSQHAHDDNIWHLQGSADGSALVSAAYKGQVRVWDAQTGELRAELQLSEAPHALAIAPDASKVVFSTLPDAPLNVWELSTNLCTPLAQPCKGLATQMVFQSPFQLLALIRRAEPSEENASLWAYNHAVVEKFDLLRGRSEIVFQTETSLGDAAALLTPDGGLLAWTSDNPGHADDIQMAALPDGKLRERFSLPDARPSASLHLKQFSPDGKRLLIYVQDDSGFDHRNEVGDNFSQYIFRDIDAGRNLLALGYETLRNVITYACAGDPNVYVGVTEKLAFIRFDNSLTVRQLQSPGDTRRIRLMPVFSPENSWCAYLTDEGNIHVFDMPQFTDKLDVNL